MNEPTVFIIDDNSSARRGLTRVLRAAGMNAESFASAADFLALEKRDVPGCILLDVRMPEMTGPELQEKLGEAEYCLPIIFLSAHGDVPTATHTMKRGAVDFLTKPVDYDVLKEAITAALARDAEFRALRTKMDSVSARFEQLTPREHEAMKYVISGMLNKQIAGEMGIAEDTVKIHRGRVMHKLGIDSVAELVRLCEKAGIAPTEPRT